MGRSTVVLSFYTFRGHLRELENKRMVSVEDDTNPPLLVVVQNKQSNKQKIDASLHTSENGVVENGS